MNSSAPYRIAMSQNYSRNCLIKQWLKKSLTLSLTGNYIGSATRLNTASFWFGTSLSSSTQRSPWVGIWSDRTNGFQSRFTGIQDFLVGTATCPHPQRWSLKTPQLQITLMSWLYWHQTHSVYSKRCRRHSVCTPVSVCFTENLYNISCGTWDSNPHALRHKNLNLACLPIPSVPLLNCLLSIPQLPAFVQSLF